MCTVSAILPAAGPLGSSLGTKLQKLVIPRSRRPAGVGVVGQDVEAAVGSGDGVAEPALALQRDLLAGDLRGVCRVDEEATQRLALQLGQEQRRPLILGRRVERHPAWSPGRGAPALGDWWDPRLGQAALRVSRSYGGCPRWPTVETALLDEVDLVVAAQAEVTARTVVARVEPARGIKCETLGIAEAPREHLAPGPVHADAHDLPTQVVGVGGARRHEAFAGREVEPAVWAQLEAAAEVVARAAGNAVDQDLLRSELVARDREPGDAVRVAPRARVCVVEIRIRLLDGHAQQPVLAAVCGHHADGGRGVREQLAVADHADAAGPFCQPYAAVLGKRERPGSDEMLGNRLLVELQWAWGPER